MKNTPTAQHAGDLAALNKKRLRRDKATRESVVEIVLRLNGALKDAERLLEMLDSEYDH